MFSSSFESSNLSTPTEIQMNISLLAHIAADSELQGRYGVQGCVFANTIGYFKSYLATLPEAHLSLKKLTESVEKLHVYARYIQNMAQRRASIKEATEFSGEIAHRITALRSGEEVILPGGWVNPGSPGHAMIYHFRKEGDVLRFYIYNAGAGVEYHEKMSSTSSERYFSTKVYEFKEAAHLQLMYLIRRLVVAHLNHLHPDFDSKALYVHNIDEIIPFINDLTKDEPLLAQDLFEEVLTTTGQISGTCTQRSIHQMLKHYFKSLEDYRRFIVDFKIYAIDDYLKKHSRCSQPIQELVSYAIINTIKICDTPELYTLDEKEEKLIQLYKLQSQLAQFALQERVTAIPSFLNNFTFQRYSFDISSPTFELSALSHQTQPSRELHRIEPSPRPSLLQELSKIYNTCQEAHASGDVIWVMKQIEQVFLDLPAPMSFAGASFYDLFTQEELFEPFIQKLYDFQVLFDRCRKTAFGQNQFVAQATLQMSIIAINDDCHRKYAKINGKPDFSPFFAYFINGYFKGYAYSPYLASHHVMLDERFQALRGLYTNEEKSDDMSSAYLDYYNQLIKTFPEVYHDLESRYQDQAPKDVDFHSAIVRAKAEALYVLCNQFIQNMPEMTLTPESFLNAPAYAPFCREIRKQWEYGCSILRGINPLFPDRSFSLKFILVMELNPYSKTLNFKDTFLNSANSISYTGFPLAITQHQYEVKRPEMKTVCHHENPDFISDTKRKKTSNDIQLSPYDHPTTRVINKDDFFFRDLLHLRTSQRHQASLTLDYFHEVRDYLKDPEIQRYVEGNIFEPCVLLITLEKDETFLMRFDEFVDSGLRAFVAVNKEMTHEALFFIRLSAYVNRFAAEKIPGLTNRLESDYDRISDLILSNTDQHILASLHQYRFILGMAFYQKTQRPPMKLFEELFISYFYIQTNTNLHVPLDEETSAELIFSKREFQESIKRRLPEINEDLIQRVLHHLKGHFKQQLATLRLSRKGEYLFSLEDQYDIDIENGALYQGNKKFSAVPLYMNHSPLFKHFKLEHESSCLMYPGDSIFEFFNPEGTLRFSRNSSESFRVQKEFSFGDGKRFWYELYPINPQQKKQLNLAQSCFKDGRRQDLSEAITDGDMNAWSLCSDFAPSVSAPQFILTQNHRPVFFARTQYTPFSSYETGQALCNDPIRNRFDDPKFMICTGDHIFFKRYGLSLTQAPNQSYVLKDKPTFVYQPNAKFPIPGVANMGFKEAYQKGAQTIERDYFVVPVQRFYRSGTVDNGEFFLFKHDASAVIATAQLTKIWKSRNLKEEDYPLWHYENTCHAIVFPIINGEPKPEKAADALYLSYLYLAAGQPENAWNTLQKIQQRFSLDGSYDELTYLEWIVKALPVILDKADAESVRDTPAYQACQLNALSLLTTFIMTGNRVEWPATNTIDETTANGEYELVCLKQIKSFYKSLPSLVSEKLNHYLNVERHLVQPFYLNEPMMRSLLAYYTRQANDMNGALGYKQRESTLSTLVREKRLLEDNFKLLQDNPSKTVFIPLDLEATRKRLDEIEEEVALQKRVMKRSTVLEKISIDLALPKQNIDVNTATLSAAAKKFFHDGSNPNRWYISLGSVSSDAPHLAMGALSPDISEEEFFKFYPDYYKISADPAHKDHRKLIDFCRDYLIGHRHTPLIERCENIPLLVNLLYRRAHYTGRMFYSSIGSIASELRKQERQLPKIEIYQARDVFKAPLAEVQSIFESLSEKILTLEAPMPLPSQCGLIRCEEMPSEETLRGLKDPTYILMSTAFLYYYPLLKKIEVVTEKESSLQSLSLHFNDSITALSSEDFDAVHHITEHVPTSLISETLVDVLQNLQFTQFHQQYRRNEAEFETQLGHQLDELSENPTFEQLEDAEKKAGELQHRHFDQKKQLAQMLSSIALRRSLQEKVAEMKLNWQNKVSSSLESLLHLGAEWPDSQKERQRIQIARATLKQSIPTEKDLLNLYYRALPSAYRDSMGLSEEKIQQLHQKIHEYAREKLHLQHLVRIQKALAQTEITPTEEQFLVLASTLMSKNQVSGQEDPAIMRFQLEENMLLRPRQIEALRSLLSPTVNSPHQFDERIEKIIMGGGKSKVLLPLMAQKKATGLNLVVVEVPHPLLKTNHADLNATSQKLFNQAAHIFQFDRDSDCSSGRLEEIYQQLLNIMTSKDYLITTGESVQSFRLKYLELLYSKPQENNGVAFDEWSEQVRSAAKIVRLFKERSDVIIDEVHDGLLLKRKLNYAFGEPLPISPEVIQLNISLFVFLQSKLQFPQALEEQDEQERIKNNEKALKSHWRSIKADFPRMLIYSPESPLKSHVIALCQTDDRKKEALIRYLQEEETCDFLVSCGNKAILDAFAFFKAQQKILDVTLHKQYKENYGPSKIVKLSEIKRSLAIPYAGNNKSKERSQFSSQLETMNYTIQSLRLTGISWTMLNETVQQWLTQARYEMLQTKGVSLVETKIAQAVTAHYLQRIGLRFEDLDIHDEALMERLYDALHQDDRLIYDILENQILPQINQEQHILSSNPLNHADIYRSRQGISGTPSNYRTFHQSLKFNPKTSLGTDGFIQNLLINQHPPVSVSVEPFTHLRDFLRKALESNPSITAIMDICATFTGYPAYDVAHILAESYSDRFEYILYFDSADRLCAVSSKNPDASPIVLGTSDPDEITQRLGGCPLEKRFTYYDQLHTVGVDIKQAPNACGLALIDERTQLQAFLQGVMRMRGLETGQTIAVVAQHSLTGLDGYLAHMQENEALQLKDDIFLSALEKIDNLYHNSLILHISSCKEPMQQAFLAEKFKDFFLQTQQLDLFKQYGSVSQNMRTEDVLNDYAADAFRRWERLIREAEIEIVATEGEHLLQRANAIVTETLPHCSAYIEWHENNQEGQEYQNERENQKEQQQQKEEQRDEEFFDPELREKEKLAWTRGGYKSFCSGKNSFDSQGRYYSSTSSLSLEPLARHLPGIDISESLLISQNYRDVYENQTRVLSYYLKPVHAILFRLHKGKLSACLITNQELKEITECQEKDPSDNTWIVNLKSTALSGRLPDFLLQPKESLSPETLPITLPIYEQYHELMEQACFFAGEMRILSGREVPLTWITQSPDQKLAFFEKNLMAYRRTTPQDLIDIKALFSTANKGYEYIKLNAFDDLTVMNWKERYPELSDRAIRSLKTLSEIFHDLNENPPNPMPDNAEDTYLAGHPTLPMTALAYVEQHINLHRMIQMLTKMNEGAPSQILSPLAQKVLSIDYNALNLACADDSDLLQFRILMSSISSPLFNRNVLYKPCITENPLIKKLDLKSSFSESDLLVSFLQKEDLSLSALDQILDYPQSKKSSEIIFKHPLISSLSLSYERFSSLLANLSALDLALVFSALDRMPLEPLMRIRMKALALTQFKVTEGDLATEFIHDLSTIEVWPKELILQLLKLEVNDSSWPSLWLERLLTIRNPSLITSMLSHPLLTNKEMDMLASRLATDNLSILFDQCLSKLSMTGLVQLASRVTSRDLLDKLVDQCLSKLSMTELVQLASQVTSRDLLDKLVDVKPFDELLAKTIWTNAVAGDDVRKKLLSKIASLELFQQCLMLSPELNQNAVVEAAIANQILAVEDKNTLLLNYNFSVLNTPSIKKIVTFSKFSDQTLLRVLNESTLLCSAQVFSEEFFKEKPDYQLSQNVFNALCVKITELSSSFLPFLVYISRGFESQVIEKLKSLNTTQPQASEIQEKLLSRVTRRVDFEALTTWLPAQNEAIYLALLNKSSLSLQDKEALINTRSYQNLTLDIAVPMLTQSQVQLKILRECKNSSVLTRALQSYQGVLTNEAWNQCLASNDDALLTALLSHVTGENGTTLLPRLLEKRQTKAWHSSIAQRAQQIGLLPSVISYPQLEASVKKTLLLLPSFSFRQLTQIELQTHLESVAYSPDVLLKIQRECSPSTIANLLKTFFPKEKLTDELFTSLSHSGDDLQDDLTDALLDHITAENEAIRLPILAEKNKTTDWTLKLIEKATNPDVIRQCIPAPSASVFEAMQHKWPTHFVTAPPSIHIPSVAVVAPEPVFSELSVDELRHWMSENDYSSASLLKIIRERELETLLSLFSGTDLNGKLTIEVVRSLLAKINSIENPILSWLISSGELMRLQQLHPFVYKLQTFNAPQDFLWIRLLQTLKKPDHVTLVIAAIKPKDEEDYLAILDRSRLSDEDKSQLINTRSYQNLEPDVATRILGRTSIQLKILRECRNPSVLRETLRVYQGELTDTAWSQCLASNDDTVLTALLNRITKENGQKFLPRLLEKKNSEVWHTSVIQQAEKVGLGSLLLASPKLHPAVKENWILQRSFSGQSLSSLQEQLISLKYSSKALLKVIRECQPGLIATLFSGPDLNGKLTIEIVLPLLAKIDSIESPVLSWLISSGELMRLQQLQPFIQKLQTFNAPQHILWMHLLQTLTNPDHVTLVIAAIKPKDEADYLDLLDRSRLSETDKNELISRRSYRNLDHSLVREMLPYLARRPQGLLKIIDGLQASFSDELFTLLLSYTRDDLEDGLLEALLRKVSLHNENRYLPLLAHKNQTDAWRYRLIQQAQRPDVISQCIPNPSSMIQEAMKRKWPDYFRTQPTPSAPPICPVSPVAVDKFVEDIDSPTHRPRPKPPLAPSPVDRSYGEGGMENHLPPPAPVVNTEIEHAVRAFVSHISNIKGKKFEPLVRRLNEFSAQYLRNELTLDLYKSQCKDALDQFKPQLSKAARRSLTIFEHIKEVLRVFFNILDHLVSLFSSSMMADTFTPGAQRLVGRNHFFTKSNRETDLTRAMQAFEKKLADLDNSGTSHSP